MKKIYSNQANNEAGFFIHCVAIGIVKRIDHLDFLFSSGIKIKPVVQKFF